MKKDTIFANHFRKFNMTLFTKIIAIGILIITTAHTQDHKLYNRWKIITETRLFLNLDGTTHGRYKDVIDSVKSDNVFIQLSKDGNFKSLEGDGTFMVDRDSIHLKMNDGNSSFKFVLRDSCLYLYSDEMREDHIRRKVLQAVVM
ncbi:hypothetical protein [Sphingobacterium corticibacterium]|uniref:Lipocalin-like domain-containing protein n=1 Tax=Sphingobacterium corticibacterium TaxID=2484746 RepID=A0A4Q6Y039_9SPHI|nr:hypothetical protein [Sphingobacterium corticibacterium]RZF62559.1 hypothetical protein EWE74_07115 [Sphingobacterium corticibacterium]